MTALQDKARELAATVTDPELPMLTLVDLGILRGTDVGPDGVVTVTITPTYTGCPAMATMRDDLLLVLREAGLDARVAVSLTPAWSTDWVTEHGRQVLAEHGLSAPGPVQTRSGPVPLTLQPRRRAVRCPRCGSAQAELTSEFGPTACTALYRCGSCREPFEHLKEI